MLRPGKAEIEVRFSSPSKTIFLSPGSRAEIAIGEHTVRVVCYENRFKDEGKDPNGPLDHHAFLRAGEQFRARRDDGSLLTVTAIGGEGYDRRRNEEEGING